MRTLPFDGSRHPYLTIDDFLEEMMIAVPHGINSYLFDGNMDCSINPSVKRKTAYLIPVKELFFKFFSIDDLMGLVLSNGQVFLDAEYEEIPTEQPQPDSKPAPEPSAPTNNDEPGY